MFYTAGQAEALHDMKDYGFTVTHDFSWPYDMIITGNELLVIVLWMFRVIKKARDDYIKRLNAAYDRNMEKVMY